MAVGDSSECAKAAKVMTDKSIVNAELEDYNTSQKLELAKAVKAWEEKEQNYKSGVLKNWQNLKENVESDRDFWTNRNYQMRGFRNCSGNPDYSKHNDCISTAAANNFSYSHEYIHKGNWKESGTACRKKADCHRNPQYKQNAIDHWNATKPQFNDIKPTKDFPDFLQYDIIYPEVIINCCENLLKLDNTLVKGADISQKCEQKTTVSKSDGAGAETPIVNENNEYNKFVGDDEKDDDDDDDNTSLLAGGAFATFCLICIICICLMSSMGGVLVI
jgi:hypothetical protein